MRTYQKVDAVCPATRVHVTEPSTGPPLFGAFHLHMQGSFSVPGHSIRMQISRLGFSP